MKEKLGDIHSHPTGRANLSLNDFYALLYWPRRGMRFMGLVTGSYNTFVFKSWETVGIPGKDLRQGKNKFIDHWKKRHDTLEGRNFSIAEYYKLVMYKGRPGESLRREYPAV